MLITATGGAYNSSELMHYFDGKKLKCYKTKSFLNYGDKLSDVTSKIWSDSAELVCKDCIENNVTFELPTNPIQSSIYVHRYSGDDFVERRKNGSFQDVDFLASNFTGYQLVFKMCRKNFDKIKNIYVNSKLKKILTDNTNEGKQYC